jgi:hypothetical protein
MGHKQQKVATWVCAAKVANAWLSVDGKSTNRLVDFISTDPEEQDYTTSLSIIHSDPNHSDWPDLVERMLSGHWNKEQAERY